MIGLQKAVDDPAWARAGPRSAEEVHDMALANLNGEYATVVASEAVLAALP